jgi:hypothetical protein
MIAKRFLEYRTDTLIEAGGTLSVVEGDSMTEQQRQQAFIAALERLIEQYGFTVKAQLQQEQLGSVLQIRGVVAVEPVPNWQPERTDLEAAIPGTTREPE